MGTILIFHTSQLIEFGLAKLLPRGANEQMGYKMTGGTGSMRDMGKWHGIIRLRRDAIPVFKIASPPLSLAPEVALCKPCEYLNGDWLNAITYNLLLESTMVAHTFLVFF